MKKLITICLLTLLITSLTGCGNSGSSGSTLCTDESILSKLKNDNSPEFVLDGIYYSLPVSVKEFINNGWVMTVDEYKDIEVILQANERVEASLTKDSNSIGITLANNSQVPLEAENCDVVKVIWSVSEDNSSNIFVTKYGITDSTTDKDAKAILKDKEGFKESSVSYTLVSEGEFGSRDILSFSNKNGHTLIKISSSEDWVYSLYKPLEEKAKEQASNIAAYKKEVEESCNSNYDEIVNNIVNSTNSLHTEPFCSIEGTVIIKTTGNYEGSENNLLYSGDLSLYVVEDKTGQHYCIYEGYVDSDLLKLPELAEGDVISVWGYAGKYTTFEDGYRVPTLTPGVVEKDGEIIYLSDNLQVN